MTFDLAQMIADREAGTQVPWRQSQRNKTTIIIEGGGHVASSFQGFKTEYRDEANARRIARVPLLEAEIIRLTARVAELEGAAGHVLHDIDDLAGNSEGVAGLHQNGDIAPWDSLFTGGSFEAWLASVETLRAALSTPTGAK